MEIVWHAHNAVVSSRLRARAEAHVTKIARRLNRTVGATIRFEREGTRCRVEVVLQAPRHRPLIAEGHGRYYGPALGVALAHLARQVNGMRRARRPRTVRAGQA